MAYYWRGPGVWTYKGKEYKQGDKLPELSREQNASMLAKGRIVDSHPAVAVDTSAEDQLRKDLQDAGAKINALQSAVNALQEERNAADSMIESLRAELAAAQEMVATLSAPAEKSAAAGPKGKK